MGGFRSVPGGALASSALCLLLAADSAGCGTVLELEEDAPQGEVALSSSHGPVDPTTEVLDVLFNYVDCIEHDPECRALFAQPSDFSDPIDPSSDPRFDFADPSVDLFDLVNDVDAMLADPETAERLLGVAYTPPASMAGAPAAPGLPENAGELAPPALPEGIDGIDAIEGKSTGALDSARVAPGETVAVAFAVEDGDAGTVADPPDVPGPGTAKLKEMIGDIENLKDYPARALNGGYDDKKRANLVTSVKDQGARGTCASFAALGVMETDVARVYWSQEAPGGYAGDPDQAEEHHVYWVFRDSPGKILDGANVNQAYEAGRRALVRESDWAYAPNGSSPPTPPAGMQDGSTKIARVRYFQEQGVTLLTRTSEVAAHLARGRGVYLAMVTSKQLLDAAHNRTKFHEREDRKGMLEPTSKLDLVKSDVNKNGFAEHHMELVGMVTLKRIVNAAVYDALGGGYWIVKNSWGAHRGRDGFLYVPFSDCSKDGAEPKGVQKCGFFGLPEVSEDTNRSFSLPPLRPEAPPTCTLVAGPAAEPGKPLAVKLTVNTPGKQKVKSVAVTRTFAESLARPPGTVTVKRTGGDPTASQYEGKVTLTLDETGNVTLLKATVKTDFNGFEETVNCDTEVTLLARGPTCEISLKPDTDLKVTGDKKTGGTDYYSITAKHTLVITPVLSDTARQESEWIIAIGTIAMDDDGVAQLFEKQTAEAGKPFSFKKEFDKVMAKAWEVAREIEVEGTFVAWHKNPAGKLTYRYETTCTKKYPLAAEAAKP